jgi:hypothetical protein
MQRDGADVNSLTPAFHLSLGMLAANRKAMEDCVRHIPGKESIKTVLDIRYGTGRWAKRVLSSFPKAKVLGYEWDRRTADAAWTDDRVELRVETFEPQTSAVWPVTDLLLCDFNTCTVKARGLLDDAVRYVNPNWVVFTDVAKSKLHMNYRAYGLPSPSLAEYWKAFRISGYVLWWWASHQREASTAVWRRATEVLTKKPPVLPGAG